jgi:hypothetical protein
VFGELLGTDEPDAEPEPLMPLWLFGVVLPDGLLLEELLEEPVCESRFMLLLPGAAGSLETLPDADPEIEPPVEAFGCAPGAVAVELEDDPPGAVAVPEAGGVAVVDEELEAPGPPEERSTRSSPQPASATATAEAASSSRKFGFMKNSLQLANGRTNGGGRRCSSEAA